MFKLHCLFYTTSIAEKKRGEKMSRIFLNIFCVIFVTKEWWIRIRLFYFNDWNFFLFYFYLFNVLRFISE